MKDPKNFDPFDVLFGVILKLLTITSVITIIIWAAWETF